MVTAIPINRQPVKSIVGAFPIDRKPIFPAAPNNWSLCAAAVRLSARMIRGRIYRIIIRIIPIIRLADESLLACRGGRLTAVTPTMGVKGCQKTGGAVVSATLIFWMLSIKPLLY